MGQRFKAIDWLLESRPRLTALALGVLAATGFEPLHFWPLALLAVAGLIELMARSASWKQAATIGWLFGLGHFTLGDSWIATAFTYQAAMPAWLGWIAVVGLATYLAVFPALASAGAWLLATKARLPSPSGEGLRVGLVDPTIPTPTPPLKWRGFELALILAFAACWIVTEWMRAWVFTGFVWNPLGMVALGNGKHPGLAGLAPWLGTYGLSGLIVLLAGCWLLALRRWRPDWRTAGLALLPVALLVLFPTPGTKAIRLTKVTLVQPDIRQERLNDPSSYEEQFQTLARLSRAADPAQRRLVLWPESGVPDYLREGYPERYYFYNFGADPVLTRRRLGQAVGPGAMLLSGTVDLEFRDGTAAGARNSVTALDGSGAIRGSYAKAHLVPGGEYLPLRSLAEPLGLSRLVPGDIDFWPGPGPRTLALDGYGKVGVQICYEIVFSGEVVDRANRPDFIFNPSNDGWFGTTGPPQFHAQARMRAIEEGLPLLRVTTTGISAVIDADGVVEDYLPSHRAGRIDTTVPPAHAPTLFARLGNALPLGWAALLLMLALVASRRRPG